MEYYLGSFNIPHLVIPIISLAYIKILYIKNTSTHIYRYVSKTHSHFTTKTKVLNTSHVEKGKCTHVELDATVRGVRVNPPLFLVKFMQSVGMVVE